MSSMPRRVAVAPAVPVPHAKPIITMEEWEAKAPLGEVEIRSVNFVKAASEKTPLPSKASSSPQRIHKVVC